MELQNRLKTFVDESQPVRKMLFGFAFAFRAYACKLLLDVKPSDVIVPTTRESIPLSDRIDFHGRDAPEAT